MRPQPLALRDGGRSGCCAAMFVGSEAEIRVASADPIALHLRGVRFRARTDAFADTGRVEERWRVCGKRRGRKARGSVVSNPVQARAVVNLCPTAVYLDKPRERHSSILYLDAELRPELE